MNLKGKKNVYLCRACGHGFVSLDVDEGTTPFMMPCLECGKMEATSCFYNIPQEILKDMKPAVEFYHPTSEEYATLNIYKKNHVDTFRLISRRTDGKDWVKPS